MATAAHESIPAEDYDYEALPPNFSLWENMMAGAFAGVAVSSPQSAQPLRWTRGLIKLQEHSVMYPVDMLKTRLQVLKPPEGGLYTGMGQAFRKIRRIEGIRSMWRGVSSVIIGAGPAHALYFVTYEAVKHAMGGNNAGHHPLAGAASGACATIASDALMNPFDVIKQRMQVHGSMYKSVIDCSKSVYRTEGLRAFYVSYPTTIGMSVPFTAIQFSAYGSIQQVINPQRKHQPLTHMVSGGLAGGFAAALTTPLDVIKTLLQTRGSAKDPELRHAKGFLHAAAIIKRQQGYGGFFRGLRPRILTIVPSTAICWTSYEVAKAYFVRHHDDP